MIKIFNFFENFNKAELIKYLVLNDLFKNILRFGLICPKNSKIKFTFIKFLKTLLNSLTEKEQKDYFCDFLFSQFLSNNSLQLTIENAENSSLFFDIVIAFLSKYSLVKIEFDKEFKDLIILMINYIIKFANESKKTILCDNVFKGFCGMLRILSINKYEIKLLLIENNIIDTLLYKCLFPNSSNYYSFILIIYIIN